MLMSTVDRRVDADGSVDLAHRICINKQLSVDPIPCPIAGIAAVPLPQRVPRPERARLVPPRRPHPIPPDDALDHPAVITKRPPRRPADEGNSSRTDPTEHPSAPRLESLKNHPANARLELGDTP